MTQNKDQRLPPQWREGPPGWWFDYWAVARSGKTYVPEVHGPASGADRIVMYAGWGSAAALLIVATITNMQWIAAIALGMLLATFIIRRLVRLSRRVRHARAGAGSRES